MYFNTHSMATLQVNRKLEDTSIVQYYYFQLVHVCHSREIEGLSDVLEGKIPIPSTVHTKCRLKNAVSYQSELGPANCILFSRKTLVRSIYQRENKRWYFNDISLLLAAQMNS